MSVELRRDHCMRCGFRYDSCTCVVAVEPGLLRVKPNGWNIADWHGANRRGWKALAYQKLWRDGAVLGGAAGLQIAALLDAIEPFVERELERRLEGQKLIEEEERRG